MWKLIVAFALFAGLSMFVIMQGGDNLNMAGEQHGVEASHEAPATPASSAVVPESNSHSTVAAPAAPVEAPANGK